MSTAAEVWRRIVHTGHELFVALDQLANVVIFAGNLGTWADETLSARAWRQGKPGESWQWVAFRVVIDALFSWQDVYLRLRDGEWPAHRHCRRAYETERARLGIHPQYRQERE